MGAKPIYASKTVIAKMILISIAVLYRPLYRWVQETPEAYFLIDFGVTIATRMITKEPIKMSKKDLNILFLIWSVVAVFLLSGCASLPDIANVIFGKSAQKITRTPIWVYKPDLMLTVDGVSFYGMGVTTLQDETDIKIQSQVSIDRVEISTCSRHDVCQVKGGELACDPARFQVEKSWFGGAGKFMNYHFIPSRKERDDSCANMMIAIYDKNVLAAWGYMVLRTDPDKNFPAHFTCNANDWTFAGVSVCSAKAGTIQEITFDEPVDDFHAEESCAIKKISDKEFEIQPQVGWCRASFGRGGEQFHDAIVNGYDEVLIRDGRN